MSATRILAILFVFAATSVAWVILGAVMKYRTSQQQESLQGDVAELWGERQQQRAPLLHFHWDTWEDRESTEEVNGKLRKVRERVKVHHTEAVSVGSSRIKVDLQLDQRLKGLMWYSLYDVSFGGDWSYQHDREIAGTLEVIFYFPDRQGLYDDFRLEIDGVDRARKAEPEDGRIHLTLPVEPDQQVKIAAGYESRGMDEWVYTPAEGVASLEDFELTMRTDFASIDFPAYAMSPSEKRREGDGWLLEWNFTRVVTGQNIGMVTPMRIQPGEMAANLSFSAPISLLFFFLMLLVLATLRDIDIHPINYFFLGGGFFAFHLLFGYSVDHIHLIPAFVLSSVVSILLVVSYLRLVVSSRFAFVEAAAAQLIYLVGFSLAHFWDGYTGLTVTVLSIITLFVLMQLTGRLKWSAILQRKIS